MTKEEYLVIRQGEEIPLSLFHTYFTEHGGKMDFGSFELTFPQAVVQGLVPNSQREVRFVMFENVVDRVYRYFNQKFGL